MGVKEEEESTMLEEEMKAKSTLQPKVCNPQLILHFFGFSKLSIHKQGDDERMAKYKKYMEMLQGKKHKPITEKLTYDVLHHVRPTRHLKDKGCLPSALH